MMGYETPKIDRIAKEGALLTHAYGRVEDTAPLTRKRMETIDD